MPTAARWFVVAALVALAAGRAAAAEQKVLGKRLLVRDPHGTEARRSVTIVGRETATDIPAIVGDPVTSGATLRIGVDGGSAGASFLLYPSGWTATTTGYRYAGPTLEGDPVRRVLLRRTTSGKFVLEIVLRGSVGTEPLELVPPAPGSDAVAVLTLGGGDTYCVAFGGAAGGQVVTNTATAWRVRDAVAEPSCPTFCCGFGGSCAWGDALEADGCAELAGTLGFPGAGCDGATGGCVPAPASPGQCCDLFGGTVCFAGPSVQGPPCGEAGGTFSASAICNPAGGCVAP